MFSSGISSTSQGGYYTNRSTVMRTNLDPAIEEPCEEVFLDAPMRPASKTLEDGRMTFSPESFDRFIDKNNPYSSFNITMMEEQLKITERALDLGFRTPSQKLAVEEE